VPNRFIRGGTQVSPSRFTARAKNERRLKQMPRCRNSDLAKIQAATDTTCPNCDTRVEPKDYKRVDWEHLECPGCGKQFIPRKGQSSRVQRLVVPPASSGYERPATILRYSDSVNAFKVSVVTLPSAPIESVNVAPASSLGNSETNTASYRPMVKYQA
jgi:hypothetical protein